MKAGVRNRMTATIVTIKEGDPHERHVVIVDDLVMTGGTILETAKVLHDAGALSVSAYVTHGVFPEDSWQRFTANMFNRVWITDSCQTTVEIADSLDHFQILSLAPLITQFVLSCLGGKAYESRNLSA